MSNKNASALQPDWPEGSALKTGLRVSLVTVCVVLWGAACSNATDSNGSSSSVVSPSTTSSNAASGNASSSGSSTSTAATGAAATSAAGASSSSAGTAQPAMPELLDLSPATGQAGEAYPIHATLRGRGFAARGNIVNFGSMTVPDLPSTDGTQITFFVPKVRQTSAEAPPLVLQPGDYPVSVTTPAGTSGTKIFTMTRDP